MKKNLIYCLVFLAGLTVNLEAASLSCSNLGNGITLLGGTQAVSTGTVRFGVFPAGYDFAANASDYSALDAAFIEVASFSGPISVLSTDGFFDLNLTYSTSATFEGTAFDSTPGTTPDTSTTDIVGEKIYVWILNNTTAATATQQAIFSSSTRWIDADTFPINNSAAAIDSDATGLVAHLGQLAAGSDIGAGVNSHVMWGQIETVSNVVASRNPAGSTLLIGTSVTFSYTAQGTTPFTQKWYKTGNPTELGSGPTFAISSAQVADSGTYSVVVTNPGGNSTSNVVTLNVVNPLPAFSDQPDPVAGKVGSDITLSVVSAGQEPLSYRWLKGTAAVPGGTSATLTLYQVGLLDAGLYRCEVSNVVAGRPNKLLSSQALVTIAQDNIPAARVVVRASPTGSTTLTASYTETGVLPANKATLQWKKDNVTIIGATAKTLKITTPVALATPVLYICEVQAVGVALPVQAATTQLYVVSQAPVLLDTLGLNMPDGVVGNDYTYQVPFETTTALNAPASFTAIGLPSGISLNRVTGLISGRPLAITKVGGAKIKITISNGVLPNDVSLEDTIEVAAMPTNLAGTWVGPVGREVLSQNLGGRLEMTVARTGVISGKIYLGTAIHSLVGSVQSDRLTSSATATINIKRLISQAPLVLTFDLANNVLSNGSVIAGAQTLSFEGWRNKWLATPLVATAADYMARYNMLLKLSDNADVGVLAIPQGTSFASFTVAKDGKFGFVGKLADGEAITGSTFIGPTGQAFMFQTLYKSVPVGSFLGKITIDSKSNSAPGDNTLTGTANWNRPANLANTNPLYRSGFGPVDLGIEGGAYAAPVSPLQVLNFISGDNNATVTVTDGGLVDANSFDDIVEAASIKIVGRANNVITVANVRAKNVKLTATATTGVMAGTIFPYTKSMKLEGLIVPRVTGLEAVGFCLFDVPSSVPLSRVSGKFELK